jgi:DNA-binding transcriptional ArsR family regulator
MDDQTAGILALIGHPERFALLLALLQAPATEADLVETIGLPQQSATRHLKALAAGGLITRKGGRGRYELLHPNEVLTLLEHSNRLVELILSMRLEATKETGKTLRRGRIRPATSDAEAQ